MQIVEKLTKEQVLNKISQEEIMERYFGSFQLGRNYINKFREGDTEPGCFFSYSPRGILYFCDYGNNKVNLDCFDIAMLATGKDFYEVLTVIYNDLRLHKKKPIENFSKVEKMKEPSDIRMSIIDFRKEDYAYWNKGLISPETLDFFNVKKCSKVWINKKLWAVSRNDNPIYRYREEIYFKVYRPFASKKEKWRTNFPKGVLGGMKQLPEKGDCLIITKSLKDVMTLYSIGVNAINIQSESETVDLEILFALEERFRNIFFYMDNDIVGINAMNRLCITFALNGFTNPQGKPKDAFSWASLDKNEFTTYIKKFIENESV